MFKFNRPKLDPAEQREYEQMQATVAQQAATIDYLAMMTDVDLPGDNTEGGVDDE